MMSEYRSIAMVVQQIQSVNNMGDQMVVNSMGDEIAVNKYKTYVQQRPQCAQSQHPLLYQHQQAPGGC